MIRTLCKWPRVLLMRIEEIGQPIRVLADFSGGSAVPVRFLWGGRTYKVTAVNGKWTQRDEDGLCLHYSVQVGDETYYLHLSNTEVQWWLDRVILES